eukprot:COSAG06_NODE_3251_length_5615_cov_5.697426_2_plen_224_part_00
MRGTVLSAVQPTTSSCDPSPRFPRAQLVKDFSEEHLNASRWIVTVYTENSGGQCGFGVGRYGKCLPEKCLDGRAGRLAISQQRQLVHRGGRCFNYTSDSVITHSKGGLERQGQCRLPAGSAREPCCLVGARRELPPDRPAHWLMLDTVKDVPTKGSRYDLGGGKIDLLDMMGRRTCSTYHWQFFLILNAATGGSRTWASSPSTAQHSKRSSRPDPPQDRIRVR